MKQFVTRHADKVIGVLSGFDRLVFRGTLIPLVLDRGMHTLLDRVGVMLLDFRDSVREVSEAVKEAALKEAVDHDRSVRDLASSGDDKEALARRLLEEHPVERGLIGALKVVEPCMSFEYHRSRDRAARGLRLVPRKCLHLYKYWLHPVFGFMSARLQTWFPFNIQICMS